MTIIDIEPLPVTDDDMQGDTRPTTVEVRPPVPAPPAATTTARGPRKPLLDNLAGPLSRRWGLALVAAWVVVVAVGLMVEPAPVNPDAAPPLIADILSTGLLAMWGAMAAGIFQGRRLAAAASLAGGIGLLALSIGCPLSGHHAGIGAWWGIQIAGSLALMGLSGRALRSS